MVCLKECILQICITQNTPAPPKLPDVIKNNMSHQTGTTNNPQTGSFQVICFAITGSACATLNYAVQKTNDKLWIWSVFHQGRVSGSWWRSSLRTCWSESCCWLHASPLWVSTHFPWISSSRVSIKVMEQLFQASNGRRFYKTKWSKSDNCWQLWCDPFLKYFCFIEFQETNSVLLIWNSLNYRF